MISGEGVRYERIFVSRNPVNVEKKIMIITVQRLFIIIILGVTINKNMDWKEHINDTYAKVNRYFYALRKVKKFLTIEDTQKVYMRLRSETPLNMLTLSLSDFRLHKNTTLKRIFRRTHRIMASDGDAQHCNCETFNERQHSLCIKLFLKAERDSNHLLHPAIPKRFENSGRLQVPYCRKEKKRKHTYPHVALLLSVMFLSLSNTVLGFVSV